MTYNVFGGTLNPTLLLLKETFNYLRINQVEFISVNEVAQVM